MEDIVFDLDIIGTLILIGSFLFTYTIIPKIIWVVNSKKLIDQPNDRSSHSQSTPTMAGVSFFLTLVFAVFFIKNWDVEGIGMNLIASLTLIFALGLKDDLVMSSPRAKIMGEFMAILFVLFSLSLELTTLNGFWGLYELPQIVFYGLNIFIVLTIMNAYNLIDGIDGLASSFGIVAATIFAVIFYYFEVYYYFLICLSLIGILSAFLRFNLSRERKIFMGDTGSLVVGFCLGFLALRLMVIESHPDSINPNYLLENKLYILVAILFLPLFDTFRVFFLRLIKGKSPFHPDRNHIHHILIDRGLSHFRASIILSLSNLIFAGIFIYITSLFNSLYMLLILIAFGVFFLVFFHLLKKGIPEVKK